MSLVDKGFHFSSKGSGHYHPFIFQKNTFTECSITAVGIIRKEICGHEVLFWSFMDCVSDQSLENGVVFSF